VNRATLTARFKQHAADLGFSYAGISCAEFLEEEAPRLENWLNQGMHGKMTYMANHFDKRLDPTLLVPGARTVVSLLYNYHNPDPTTEGSPKISQYAYGKDYHHVLKPRLKDLVDRLREEVGEVEGRVFVDSAPVLERAWAARSGVGWIGKNAQLINPRSGSWFFLAELIIDTDLEPDRPMEDRCGTCTACIDACPTDAIVGPQVVDGSKCISYFTIELKDEVLPDEMKGKFENWAFGCDICQDVCPWNRFSNRHQEPAFDPQAGLLERSLEDWEEMTEEVFREWFRQSPVKRTGFKGMQRNLKFLGLNPAGSSDNEG
jgi:epoxyqueuosine reductase